MYYWVNRSISRSVLSFSRSLRDTPARTPRSTAVFFLRFLNLGGPDMSIFAQKRFWKALKGGVS